MTLISFPRKCGNQSFIFKNINKNNRDNIAKGENLPHELRNVDANRKFHLKAVTSIYYFD